MGSTLKGKNLLLKEQTISSESCSNLEGKQKSKDLLPSLNNVASDLGLNCLLTDFPFKIY